MVDIRQLVFATLWKKYEKKINTEEVKNEIRTGEATYKFADYGTIRLKDYTTSKYSEEDQKEIDKFIEEKGFKKIVETKPNYSVEFVPSEKAIKEFDKMIEELQDSQYKNIAKVASNVANNK